MKKISFSLPALLLLIAGCGGNSGGSTTIQPTLSSIQSNIFNKSCALASCHSVNAAQGNLVLASGQSFSNLVNVSAANSAAAAANKKRVVPGDPSNSFLVQKLEGPGAGEGNLMPNQTSGLSQEKIDVIRQWITDGALDN